MNNIQNVVTPTAAPMIDRYVSAPGSRRTGAGFGLMPIIPVVGVNVHAKGQVSFIAKDAVTPAWAPPPRRVPL